MKIKKKREKERVSGEKAKGEKREKGEKRKKIK